MRNLNLNDYTWRKRKEKKRKNLMMIGATDLRCNLGSLDGLGSLGQRGETVTSFVSSACGVMIPIVHGINCTSLLSRLPVPQQSSP
jgi:hypothetical protein